VQPCRFRRRPIAFTRRSIESSSALRCGCWCLPGGSSTGYIKLVLGAISALVVMAIGIPFALSRTHARNGAPALDETAAQPDSFAAWLRGNFATSTGACKATTAAVEILLPIAAVAFGMTAFGIVFLVARSGAP
jgi:hypothetical protein